MSCNRATSATTCSARPYSPATDTCHLLSTEQNNARFVQCKPVVKRVRSTMAIVADTEATVICAPSLSRHRHPVTPRCDSDYVESPHHAERPRRSRGTFAEPPFWRAVGPQARSLGGAHNWRFCV